MAEQGQFGLQLTFLIDPLYFGIRRANEVAVGCTRCILSHTAVLAVRLTQRCPIGVTMNEPDDIVTTLTESLYYIYRAL